MKSCTIDDVMRWRPCYVRAVVEKLAQGRTEATALEILRMEHLIAEDRLWLVLRPELIDGITLRLFAADCAEHVLSVYERQYPGDLRPRQAIEAARAYARGEISGDARAAAEAADAAAAGATAAAAARSAAWAAAEAAEAADAAEAGATAAAAARSAAWAAGAAAAGAERTWQIERLAEKLERGET
jgi:hypothetical protein